MPPQNGNALMGSYGFYYKPFPNGRFMALGLPHYTLKGHPQVQGLGQFPTWQRRRRHGDSVLGGSGGTKTEPGPAVLGDLVFTCCWVVKDG